MAKGQGAVVGAEPSVARRMWRVLRAVLYMLRRGVPSVRKLAMDLHLLLHRGKIAGKALGDLLTFHHHRDGAAGGYYSSSSSYAAAGAGSGSFSCRALDPGLAVHEPAARARRREVEFSCSNTPSDSGGGLGLLGVGRRSRRRHRDNPHYYHDYDAADVARVFELLNDDGLFADEHPAVPAYATPSPVRLLWAFARSPAAARPAPSGGDDAQVDRQADEFIRRFYEQLRAQRSAASTPDCYGYAAASPYVSGGRRTPRAIAAGTA